MTGTMDEGPMITDRMTARMVGVLFIAATTFAILGGSLLLPLDEEDYLGAVAAQQGQVISGALLEMLLVLSVVGIATLLFPVLRRRSEGLAIAYVGARILEGVLLMVAAVSALVVFGLSRDGLPAAQELGDLALATREWTYLIGSEAMLGVGALILYGLLYAAKLVPDWLSLWGLAGGALILVGGILEVYGVGLSPLAQGLVAAPIAINEMVLAIRLIAMGFDRPADATGRRTAFEPPSSVVVPPAPGSDPSR